MGRLDPTVKKETVYIALWVLILSALMQAVFLILHALSVYPWDYTILCGNVLGGAAAVINFLLMGITVQNAVKKDEQDAKNLIRASQLYRMFGLILIVVIGVVAPIFYIWAVIIPLLFPRIAIALRPLFDKKKE